MEPDPDVPGFAPSPITHPAHQGEGEVPQEMTQADIDETIASFVRSAVSARELGFDGVELHGAHSYLINQFFFAVTNQRADRYGGAFENHLTFALELITVVRAAVGPTCPIVFRFSQWKQGDFDYKLAKNPDELERFLIPLAGAGVDLFHASTRRFNDLEFEDSDLNLAGWAKKIIWLPSITVGSVGLDALIQRLERSEFDLVAVGRPLLSDPAWAQKLEDGREDKVVAFEGKHLSLSA